MSELVVSAMTEEEFQRWSAYSRANYAAEHVKSGMSEEAARAEAEDSTRRHLGQGKETPGQYLYTVRADGTEIGILWWGAKPAAQTKNAWIYDIELKPAMRGQGLGRKLMAWATHDAKEKGFTRLGLHVFGHNRVARGLYESMGFETTNVVMSKAL